MTPDALGIELEPVLTALTEVLLVAGQGDSNIVNSLETLSSTVPS